MPGYCCLVEPVLSGTVYVRELLTALYFHFGQVSVDARKEQVASEEASLKEWEKRLEEGRARLQEGERLLNERENSLKQRDEALKQTSRELAETRSYIENERALIKQTDADLNARVISLSERERVCFPRLSHYYYFFVISVCS